MQAVRDYDEADIMWSNLEENHEAARSPFDRQERISEKEKIRLDRTIKELSDLKYALDQAAIVAITDTKGIIRYVNDKFCELSKYSRSELIGQPHSIIKSGEHSKEFFRDLWSSINSGKVWKGEIKNRAKDGTYYWVDTTIVPFVDDEGKPYQYLSIRFDITDRKLAEEKAREALHLQLNLQKIQWNQAKLVHREKMLSLEQLVAGIAHEINNPVNFIHGNLVYTNEYFQDLLRMMALYAKYYPEPELEIQSAAAEMDLDFIMEDLPNILSSMHQGTSRIHEIVKSLRNFARLDEADIKAVDIHSGIDSSLMILQKQLHQDDGDPIRIIKEYGKLPLVECYPSQMNQVFMNILTNAIDALSNQPPPRAIAIKTKLLTTVPEGVLITIADNGPGIPEKVQEQIFNPFFTTKPVGKGTGLGLSISHQIVVEQHQGQLTCLSSPGEGAKFIICIPLHPAELTTVRDRSIGG
ncbi:MAG: sensor histidine kinase [Hormoscilla sp.]